MDEKFPKYATTQAAASNGCFNCVGKLDAAKAEDKGYPAGRGQYAIRCAACGMSTFFDLIGKKQ
jgi:hypothetical protein